MSKLDLDLKAKADVLSRRIAEIAGQLRLVSGQFKFYTADTIEDGEASQRLLRREQHLKDEMESCNRQLAQLYEEQDRRDRGES